MKLIAGLGNPGVQYQKTRHNTGFLTMDALASRLSVSIDRQNFEADTAKINYHGETVLLMKPLTYMNESGRAIAKAVNFYHLDPENDLLVIYDDLDLPCGKLRLREKGSAGGHNGIKSIIQHVGTQQFRRIRIGIDKNPLIPTPDYVLGKVEPENREKWESAISRAAEAAMEFITAPFQDVMNKYNKGD